MTACEHRSVDLDAGWTWLEAERANGLTLTAKCRTCGATLYFDPAQLVVTPDRKMLAVMLRAGGETMPATREALNELAHLLDTQYRN